MKIVKFWTWILSKRKQEDAVQQDMIESQPQEEEKTRQTNGGIYEKAEHNSALSDLKSML